MVERADKFENGYVSAFYTVSQKKHVNKLLSISSPNIDRF